TSSPLAYHRPRLPSSSQPQPSTVTALPSHVAASSLTHRSPPLAHRSLSLARRRLEPCPSQPQLHPPPCNPSQLRRSHLLPFPLCYSLQVDKWVQLQESPTLYVILIQSLVVKRDNY
ncbi:hypothetical protein PIB30_082656, partial [Stylosanthes scabra]|nr:hypothetical protein [Stylosanthes scabra]